MLTYGLVLTKMLSMSDLAPLDLLAEPRRRTILQLVWDRELASSEIAGAMPEITFGAVSQHLGRLREAGLVTVRPDGRHRYYRADHGALGPLADALDAMWASRLDALRTLAEAAVPETEADAAGRRPPGEEADR